MFLKPKCQNKVFQLAATGDIRDIEKLVAGDTSVVSKIDEKGMTMIHHAALHGRTNVIDLLMVYQADMGCKDNNENTAMHHAVLGNQPNVVTYLILNGADANLVNEDHFAPIHLSVYKKKLEVLKELLKHPEVNVDAKTKCGNNSAHIACEIDYQEGLRVLLDAGIHICIPNIHGIYPIHVAIKYCHEICLEMLVTCRQLNGYTPQMILNFSDKEGNVPLHTAVNTGDTKAVQMCIHYGAKIDVRQNDNSTPLHYACTKGELDIVKFMIQSQPEIKESVLKIKDNNGHTPIHKAVMFNHVELTVYLINEGSDIETTDDNGWTPLLLAASRLNVGAMKTLINNGANVFARDNYNRNIIHLVTLNIIQDKTEFLFEMEKSQPMFHKIVNDRDNAGCTPLHYSTRRGLMRFTGSLIQLGGLCETQNNDNDTPLHFAARYGRVHTCQKILNTVDGIKTMNSTDALGKLPIHAAAENGHTKIIRMMLDKGCIFHRCYHGNTPLHYAAANGHLESCQYLIEMNQALLDNQNAEGKTALHLAAINDHSCIVGLLLTHGALILLDKQGLSFFTHVLKLKNINTAKEIVANSRWEEIMHTVDESGICPIIGMTKEMPNIFSLAMDKSISTEGSRGKKEFKIIYNFGMLQRTVSKKEDLMYDPFFVVKTMIHWNRVDLLMHPLCSAYLKMKWERFGRWIQYFILLLYIVYLTALSFSTYTITFTAMSHINRKKNFTTECRSIDILYGHSLEKKFLIAMAMIIMVYCVAHLLCEALQIITKKLKYFTQYLTYLKLALYILSVILATNIIQMKIEHSTMQIAAITIFIGWFYLLLLMFHFEMIGLFVIMFVQILKTVIKVLIIFSILFIGFGFAFVILFKVPTYRNDIVMHQPLFNQCYKPYSFSQLDPSIKVWQQMPSGFVKVIVMMMGDIEFLNTYVTPLYDNNRQTLHYPTLTYLFLIVFIVFMSLLLMNLLIGLAVGDIEAVQKNATLKRISLQIEWLSEFESKLPMTIRNWVFKEKWVVYPYKCPLSNISASDSQIIYKKNENEECKDLTNVFDTLNIHEKQLYNLLVDSRQQTNLLKLIIQKMEMDPEAEISDDTTPEMTEFSKNWKALISAKAIIGKMQK